MVEEVSSGGLKSFRYKNENYVLDKKRKKDIEEAYERYYERREKERRQKIIWWIIGILMGLMIIGILALKLF